MVRWARLAVIWLLQLPIRAYRSVVSPWLPRACRFHPSCSRYAITALSEHGPWRGLVLTAKRLAKCHPFHPGGLDWVPPSPGAQKKA